MWHEYYMGLNHIKEKSAGEVQENLQQKLILFKIITFSEIHITNKINFSSPMLKRLNTRIFILH